MSDIYWAGILQQEGVVDDYKHREFSSIEESLTGIDNSVPTEPRPGKTILEPNKRLTALNRIVKQLQAFGQEEESKLATLAEHIETAAYKKSTDVDDYYYNITTLVNTTCFSSQVTGRSSSNVNEQRDRIEVLMTLKAYQSGFQNLIGDVGGRLRELEGMPNYCWTREEKELPTIYSQMTAVYQLLHSSLSDNDATGGVTTEMLKSMEKQIDLWLSLGSRFPIPYSSKANKTASIEALRKAMPQSQSTCLSPPPLCAQLPSKQPASQLPSLLYTPLSPVSNLSRIIEPRTSFNGLQLPPFNPPKTLSFKGSQPLLPSSAESALGASPLFCSSPKRVASSRRSLAAKVKDEDDALEAISNLSSLQGPGNESRPGSKEPSPRTSLSGKPTRGRKARNPRTLDQLNDRHDEHAFILSKLAQLKGEQDKEFAHRQSLPKRGCKRASPEKPEGAGSKVMKKQLGHHRVLKRARTGDFGLHLRTPVSGLEC